MDDGRLALPADGRQSETALMIGRGVRRLLRARGFSSVTELPLIDGRRADIVAVDAQGEVLIVEIKSSPADLRADRKWRDYAACCDRLYFAISQHDAGRDHSRRRRPHPRRPLRRRDRAGGRFPAHGVVEPAGGHAAFRPGRRRPAAPPRRSRRRAGILTNQCDISTGSDCWRMRSRLTPPKRPS